MAKIDAFFNLMFEQKASDLHLSSGNSPILRINGEMQRVDFPPLENDSLKTMLYEIAPEYKGRLIVDQPGFRRALSGIPAGRSTCRNSQLALLVGQRCRAGFRD